MAEGSRAAERAGARAAATPRQAYDYAYSHDYCSGGAFAGVVIAEADHNRCGSATEGLTSPQRVAVHQVTPKLKLVGLGQTLIQDQEQSRLVLGLFPQSAPALLKSETQFSLRVQAPSVELLIQDLFYSSRGQDLQKEMQNSQKRITDSWLKLWPKI